MNLTDLLSGSVISSIAGQTGTSEKDTQNVLANALPALVGAMAQNASTEDGANSLAKALDDHTSSKGLASLLQNVDTEDGTKILTKILGGETETVQNAVAKKSGASKVDTSKILAMAAPLLLAALGSQKKKTKTQSDGLGGLLTSLLGGGDDDEDDGSTLISLAGSLLGGSNKKSGKSDPLPSMPRRSPSRRTRPCGPSLVTRPCQKGQSHCTPFAASLQTRCSRAAKQLQYHCK